MCVCVRVARIGFYTAWLLPAAVVGLLVFLFGLFTVGLNQAAYVSMLRLSQSLTLSLPVCLSVCLSVCFAVSLCLLLVERCSTVVD